MTTPEGTSIETAGHAGDAGTCPMILFRYRSDVTGRITPTVHLASRPEGDWPNALTALCGILMSLEDVEQVTSNDGVPCALCLVSHIRTLSLAETPMVAPAPGPEGGPFAAEAIYRGWGWPVTLRQGQVWLALESEAVALMVPVALPWPPGVHRRGQLVRSHTQGV